LEHILKPQWTSLRIHKITYQKMTFLILMVDYLRGVLFHACFKTYCVGNHWFLQCCITNTVFNSSLKCKKSLTLLRRGVQWTLSSMHP
jgi:hypothetical protein